jgi:putative transposase
MQPRATTADTTPVTPPRHIQSNQLCFVTVRAVNRAFRFAPSPEALEIIRYCLAFTLSKYRGRIAIHELLWMSNHFHLVLTDQAGCLPRFMEELDSLLARALNALHGTFGTLIEKGYNLVEIISWDRLIEHCVYTLANPCSAHLVERSHQWRGVSSRDMKYGVPIKVKRPERSLWSSAQRHASRPASQGSKRARYVNRSKAPEDVELVLERPAIMPELSDAELRRYILEQLDQRERALIKERRAQRRRVTGWDAATKMNPRSTPDQLEERFGMVPSYSASTKQARVEAWRRRRSFLTTYYQALRRFVGGDWQVEFPVGTWLMKVRFGVSCCPLPAT